MNGCRNILHLMAAAVLALMLTVASCRHGGMTEQEARAAVDTVEAHYKAYTTDSADLPLIADADRRLDCRGVDRHTRARAAVYHGAVYDELGNPDSALIHYKRAETLCDTADHDLLGYINLRIASLYHAQYASDSVVLFPYFRAIKEFSKTQLTHYKATCHGAVGTIYAASNNDSALHYLHLSQQLFEQINEQKQKQYYQLVEAKLCLRNHKNEDALNICQKILDNDKEWMDDVSFARCLVVATARAGDTKAAKSFLSHFPNMTTSADSVEYFDALAEVYKAEGNQLAYLSQYVLSDSLSDLLLLNSKQDQMKHIEEQFHSQRLYAENLKLSRQRLIIAFSLAISLLFITLLILLLHRSHLRNRIAANETDAIRDDLEKMNVAFLNLQQDNSNLNDENTHLAEKVSSITHSNQELAELFEHQLLIIQDLMQKLTLSKMKPKNFVDYFHKVISIDKPDNSLWAKLRLYVDNKYHGLITYLIKTYPRLNNEDINFICLCYCDFPNTMILMCTKCESIHYISNKKRNIPLKKMGVNKTLDQIKNEYLSKPQIET